MNVVVCCDLVTAVRLQHMTNHCTYSVDLGGCSFPLCEFKKELLQTARLAPEDCLEHNGIPSRQTEFVIVDIHALEPVAQGSSGNSRLICPIIEGWITRFHSMTKNLRHHESKFNSIDHSGRAQFISAIVKFVTREGQSSYFSNVAIIHIRNSHLLRIGQ